MIRRFRVASPRPSPFRVLVVEPHELLRATLHLLHRVQHPVHGLPVVRLAHSLGDLERVDLFVQRRDFIRVCVVVSRGHRVPAHGVELRGDLVDDVLEHRLEPEFGLRQLGVRVVAALGDEVANLVLDAVGVAAPQGDRALDALDRVLDGGELGAQRGVLSGASAAVLVPSSARGVLRLRHALGEVQDFQFILSQVGLVAGDQIEHAVEPGGLRRDRGGRQLELGRRRRARRGGRDRHSGSRRATASASLRGYERHTLCLTGLFGYQKFYTCVRVPTRRHP